MHDMRARGGAWAPHAVPFTPHTATPEFLAASDAAMRAHPALGGEFGITRAVGRTWGALWTALREACRLEREGGARGGGGGVWRTVALPVLVMAYPTEAFATAVTAAAAWLDGEGVTGGGGSGDGDLIVAREGMTPVVLWCVLRRALARACVGVEYGGGVVA